MRHALPGLMVLALVVTGAPARGQGPAVSPAAEAAWARLAPALQAMLLTDHENGEVLGTALDLVERVDATDAPGDAVVDVVLAPGAADRLRRAGEFTRDADADEAYPLRYRRTEGAPAVRILLRADRGRGRIELAPRP